MQTEGLNGFIVMDFDHGVSALVMLLALFRDHVFGCCTSYHTQTRYSVT